MRRYPVRSLFYGPPAASDRILFYSRWFAGHNNAIYAELIPRLERVDPYLLVFPNRRLLRAPLYRAWERTKPLHERALFARAAKRYVSMFTTDNEQIPFFSGAMVAGVDDPRYTPREVELLNHPNVRAYVVTAERAARRLEQLGVETPWHVIPLGFSRSSLSEEWIAAIAARRKKGPVVGYMAAWLLSRNDRGGDSPLYNVDHLLELWDEIHRRVPSAQLWLIGDATQRVRDRLRGRDDIVAFGRLERDEALNTAAAFDVALYPRTEDRGVRASKVGEYLGLGLPVVSYDLEVTDEVRELDAGVLVGSAREFVDAVDRLLIDLPERQRLAANARAAGAARDWDVLAAEYARLLDAYLPPARAAGRSADS
jgi:glycosyltransferase involved in cell wall biosynthesis